MYARLKALIDDITIATTDWASWIELSLRIYENNVRCYLYTNVYLSCILIGTNFCFNYDYLVVDYHENFLFSFNYLAALIGADLPRNSSLCREIPSAKYHTLYMSMNFCLKISGLVYIPSQTTHLEFLELSWD